MPSNKRFFGRLLGIDPLLQSSPASGDEHWDDVVLLLDGTSRTDDKSPAENDMNYNNVSLVSDTDLYGETKSVLQFTGSNNSRLIEATGSGDFKFGTEDFTIEFWAKCDITTSNAVGIIEYNRSNGSDAGSPDYFVVHLSNNEYSFWTSLGKHVGGTVTDVTDWNHVAFTRSGTSIELFLNGTSADTATDMHSNMTSGASRQLFVGRQDFTEASNISFRVYDGQLADVRITKGVARDIAADWAAGAYNSALPQGSYVAATIGGPIETGVRSLDSAGPESIVSSTTTIVAPDYSTDTQTKITASDAATGDGYGRSTAISGDSSVYAVGAPGGDAVYVYEGGSEFILTAPSMETFGRSIAISKDGTTLVVADDFYNLTYYPDAGGLFIYERPSGGWATTSTPTATLASIEYNHLGESVDISDDGSVVVASSIVGGGGEVVVYEKPSGGWANATDGDAELSSPGADAFAVGQTDNSVAISGDGTVIAVGANAHDTGQSNSGSVFIYDKPSSGGWATTSTATHELGANPRISGDRFGTSVSLNEDGTSLAVGTVDYGTNTLAGAVYLLENSGGTWSQSAILTGSGGLDVNIELGTTTKISRNGGVVISGAPRYDTTTNGSQGAVFLWIKPSGGWSNSTHDEVFLADDAAEDDLLGSTSLSIDTLGNNFLAGVAGNDDAGSNSGSAYLITAGTPGGSTTTTTTTKATQRRWGGITGRSLVESGANVIDHSLRFDGSPDYLGWSPTTDGNMKKWTWSGWVKRHVTGTFTPILGAASSTSAPYFYLSFSSSTNEVDTLRLDQVDTPNVVEMRIKSQQTFSSTDTWYHIIVSYDAANTTAADRVKWWVNGQSVDTNGTNGRVYPSSTQNTFWNDASHTMYHGRNHSAYGKISLAEVHLLDGYALQETSPSVTVDTFGETHDGQWVPKEVTGVTYGTNGFYLDFADNSTASALGTDVSGNSNDFSVNGNITPADQLIDTPNQITTDALPTTGVLSLSEHYQNTFVAAWKTDIEYMIIAGGGGGGYHHGGGGGAGGVLYGGAGSVTYTGPFTLTVGDGGGTMAQVTPTATSLGDDSEAFGLTAIGGGFGGSGGVNPAQYGSDGGSGGGEGGYDDTGNPPAYGDATAGQGYRGGRNSINTPDNWTNVGSGGGGGGAGGVGGDCGTQGGRAGDGGIGITNTFLNELTYGEQSSSGNYYVAGGGGAGGWNGFVAPGLGSTGGGGAGGHNATSTSASAGTAGYGGGGGGRQAGGGTTYPLSGAGGSGAVLIRVPQSVSLTVSGGTLTIPTPTSSKAGYSDYKFTTVGSGTITMST